jgi:hypothetical protein
MASSACASERSPDVWRRRIAERTSNSVKEETTFAAGVSGSKKRTNDSLPSSRTKSFARALESKKNRFRSLPDL